MLRKLLWRKFEHNHSHALPPKALAIVRSVANDFMRRAKNRNHASYSREMQIAHAVLHMRLYQKFGTESREFIADAYKLLNEIIEERSASATPAVPLLSQNS